MNNYKLSKKQLLACILCSAIAYSDIALSAIVNFETTPVIPIASRTFGRAGPAQTIDVNGTLTFSGGVVLGLPTFLPVTPFSTPPNLYGTANHPSGRVIGHPTLRSSLSIDLASSIEATTIEGLLFNGLNRSGSYTIEAFSNEQLVDSLTLNDLAPNLSTGFELFRLDSNGLPITSVLFTPDLSDGEWDYFIDTIAINESLMKPDDIVVPIPSMIWLFASGVISLLSFRKTNNTN